MQPTESRQRDNLVATRRHGCWNSTTGSVLPKSEMSPVLVVITDVLSQQPSQVPLIENDHVIDKSRRTLPTQRSAIPFCQGLRGSVASFKCRQVCRRASVVRS